jgi:NTE family protein
MFGAYQAGAWKAIAEIAPPDIVVGASVGALNGWPIAAGCPPDELIERWRDPSTANCLRLYPGYGWRRGWFDPAPLRETAEELRAAYNPVIPFGVVLTQLPFMKARLFECPHVEAVHLHATCSIPFFLPPVRIDGASYIDGGAFEKMPVWAAVEMGATRIIAVDSLPLVGRKWVRLALSTAHLFRRRRRLPPDLDLTIIAPSEPLGDANDAVFWKRANVERWIEMGMRDAERTLGEPSVCRAVDNLAVPGNVTVLPCGKGEAQSQTRKAG